MACSSEILVTHPTSVVMKKSQNGINSTHWFTLRAQNHLYSAVHGFWFLEVLVKVVDRSTGWGELARVGVYMLGTSVWQGELCLWRWREGLHQTWCCHCISDLFLAYHLKVPLAKNQALHFNNKCMQLMWWLRTLSSVKSELVYIALPVKKMFMKDANIIDLLKSWQWLSWLKQNINIL
jgi:hypothetical protein